MGKVVDTLFKNIGEYLDRLVDHGLEDVGTDALLIGENVTILRAYIVDLEEKLSGTKG